MATRARREHPAPKDGHVMAARRGHADAAESAGDYQPPRPAAPVAIRPQTVPMASVVVHPANPRRDLGDLTELEESIRELGVLQPPVVLPAARVASAWPQHAGELAGADWVVLMGARRRTAAGNVAGGDPAAHLPVLVREDAIADDPLGQLDVMTAENVARAPLSPLEEARSFAEQVKSGRSQREIAARMGCSQGQVSKRLKLLALAPALIKELEAGKLEVGEALAYAEAGDHGQMLAARKLVRTQSWRSVTDAVRSIQDKAKAARAVEAATARLAKENVPVIASASQRFGSDYWKQELRGAPTIRQARKDGTAVATISASTGDITYYTTTKPKRSTAARSPAEQQRITDERERRVAMHARQQAAAALAARAPKLTEAHAADIVDAWLWAPGNDTSTLARVWLVDAGVGPDPQLQPYEWWDQVRRGTWPVRVHAAHALALARYEVHARITYNRWNEQDAAWLARLREHTGYQPTEWEQARLADVDERTRATPAPPAGGEGPQAACLAFDHDDRRRWGLYLDLEVDAPHA